MPFASHCFLNFSTTLSPITLILVLFCWNAPAAVCREANISIFSMSFDGEAHSISLLSDWGAGAPGGGKHPPAIADINFGAVDLRAEHPTGGGAEDVGAHAIFPSFHSSSLLSISSLSLSDWENPPGIADSSRPVDLRAEHSTGGGAEDVGAGHPPAIPDIPHIADINFGAVDLRAVGAGHPNAIMPNILSGTWLWTCLETMVPSPSFALSLIAMKDVFLEARLYFSARSVIILSIIFGSSIYLLSLSVFLSSKSWIIFRAN